MSFAFPAVLLFLALLPGVFFWRAYSTLRWRDAVPPTNYSFEQEIVRSIFFSIILNGLWVLLFTIFGHPINSRAILIFLTGVYDRDPELASTLEAAYAHPAEIAVYFFSLLLFSVVAGLLLFDLVRRKKWDKKYRLLKFAADWYYLLSGEMIEFEQPDVQRRIDGVFASAVVEQGETAYLFWGIVSKFYFNKSGDLDRILLAETYRRPLSEDRKPEEPHEFGSSKFYPIEGDYFVLFLSQVKTLNIEYFALATAEEEPPLANPDLSGSSLQVS